MKANDVESLCYQRVLHIPTVAPIKLSNLIRECYISLHCGNFLKTHASIEFGFAKRDGRLLISGKYQEQTKYYFGDQMDYFFF